MAIMALPKEFEKLNVPSMINKRASKSVRKYIRMFFIFSSLILTYFVSNKLGIMLQTIDLELLQRVINLGLVAIVVYIIAKK